MSRVLKVIAKKVLTAQFASRVVNFIVRTVRSHHVVIVHQTTELKLAEPGPQIRSRNKTFSTKEPATLAWIESFGRESVLWDIGANIGLYSVYAAKLGVKVVAVEPSVFNLEFLVKNINLNQVSDSVDVLPIAVGGSDISLNRLNLSSMAWGDSQNSFGTTRGQYGTDIEVAVDYRLLGASLDCLAEKFNLQQPDYIKVDVDGIEAEIVESGLHVLRQVRGVLIESPVVEDDAQRIRECLTRAGLNLVQSERRNTIWSRTL